MRPNGPVSRPLCRDDFHDTFSSREPVSTTLENALARQREQAVDIEMGFDVRGKRFDRAFDPGGTTYASQSL